MIRLCRTGGELSDVEGWGFKQRWKGKHCPLYITLAQAIPCLFPREATIDTMNLSIGVVYCKAFPHDDKVILAFVRLCWLSESIFGQSKVLHRALTRPFKVPVGAYLKLRLVWKSHQKETYGHFLSESQRQVQCLHQDAFHNMSQPSLQERSLGNVNSGPIEEILPTYSELWRWWLTLSSTWRDPNKLGHAQGMPQLVSSWLGHSFYTFSDNKNLPNEHELCS